MNTTPQNIIDYFKAVRWNTDCDAVTFIGNKALDKQDYYISYGGAILAIESLQSELAAKDKDIELLKAECLRSSKGWHEADQFSAEQLKKIDSMRAELTELREETARLSKSASHWSGEARRYQRLYDAASVYDF